MDNAIKIRRENRHVEIDIEIDDECCTTVCLSGPKAVALATALLHSAQDLLVQAETELANWLAAG